MSMDADYLIVEPDEDEVDEEVEKTVLVLTIPRNDGDIDIVFYDEILDALWDALLERNQERLTRAAINVMTSDELLHESESLLEDASARYEFEKARSFPNGGGSW